MGPNVGVRLMGGTENPINRKKVVRLAWLEPAARRIENPSAANRGLFYVVGLWESRFRGTGPAAG